MGLQGVSQKCFKLFLILGLVSQWCSAQVGPARGTLLLTGGGPAPADDILMKRFVDLVGGPNEPIVVIPTANGAASYDQTYQGLVRLRAVGATNLTLLHTSDRATANSDKFVEPLRRAKGVFIFGGTDALLMDSYLDTLTQREFVELLNRGGVIGGASAGAAVQGSFLARGNVTDATALDLNGSHQVGFGFLHNVAIDTHFLVRNRQFDLLQVTQLHPELLGIGIDEQAGIVVQQDQFEVIGRNYVVIYDTQRQIPPNGTFYLLAPGDRYNLRTREAATRGAVGVGAIQQPIDRVKKVTSQE